MEIFPSELIYDAAMDDASLKQLSVSLVDYLGARSGVIHWRECGSQDEYVSYSGYYSDDQMAAYSRHFSDADLWAKAISLDAPANRAINLAQLVPTRVYENSRIYNEWVCPMGDDTFHCLGARLRVGRLEGHLGFHRGRRQPPFDHETTTRLEHVLGHLGRMMAIKSRLSGADRKGNAVVGTLNTLADALFTLDDKGRLLFSNAAGEAMLKKGQALRLERGRLISTSPQAHRELEAAVSKALASSCPEPSTFRQQRPSGGNYLMTVVGSANGGTRSATVFVSSPNVADPTLASRLCTLHRLTPAEAQVAMGIAAGASVSELADERGTSIGTLRGQVKAIASKLGCGRQSEIASIVNSVPRLWPNNRRDNR